MPSVQRLTDARAVSLGNLSDDDFQAAVEKARAAGRATLGLPPTPPPTPKPEPVPAAVVRSPLVPRTTRTRRVNGPLVTAGLLVFIAGAGGVLYWQWPRFMPAPAAAVPPPAAEGTVKIVTRPAGARVTVDGVARGTSPLNLSLVEGQHILELDNGTDKRAIPVTIERGGVIAQYVDLAAPGAAVGRLEVTADPAGTRVTVDGVERGTTPLLLTDLTPGEHMVALAGTDGVVTRKVMIAAGGTASVMASLTPAGSAAGWLAIQSPFPVEILEKGSVIAAAGVERVMLPVGRHQIDAVSTELGFQAPLTVQVQPGRTASVTITAPDGTLSVNAVPWADVTLDGKSIGTTPIGNLKVPVGAHELVWKHPKFGERRQTVTVTAQGPARAGVDFTK